MKQSLALCILGLAAWGACEGTETGNPVTAEVRAHAHSSRPAEVAVGEGASVATIDAVWLAGAEVALLADDCTTTVDAGTLDADLATTVTQASVAVTGEVCGARLTLDASAPPADAPPALDGAAVLVLATRADGTEVVARLATVAAIDIVAVAGLFDLPAATPDLFLGADVAQWFGDLDLATATPDGGGVIRIDATADPTRTAQLAAKFARGFELYRDLDGDGAVSGPSEVLLAQGATP